MGWLVSLALRLLGFGSDLMKALIDWVLVRWERPLLIGLALAVAMNWGVIIPRLNSRITGLNKDVAAEKAAHQKSKANYSAAAKAATDKARAMVQAEKERQDDNAKQALASYHAGIDDLDFRAERLRNQIAGAGAARGSSRADLPATVAHPGGAADARSAARFPLPVGAKMEPEEGQMTDAKSLAEMGIEERLICTRQAHQLDAILSLDSAMAEGTAKE